MSVAGWCRWPGWTRRMTGRSTGSGVAASAGGGHCPGGESPRADQGAVPDAPAVKKRAEADGPAATDRAGRPVPDHCPRPRDQHRDERRAGCRANPTAGHRAAAARLSAATGALASLALSRSARRRPGTGPTRHQRQEAGCSLPTAGTRQHPIGRRDKPGRGPGRQPQRQGPSRCGVCPVRRRGRQAVFAGHPP